MTTTIHLVRHGQTNWNVERRIQGQTESSLTPMGIEQAREVAKQLQNVKFDRAYSSSSERARDTARYILEHHEVDLELRDNLREIFLGEWEGQLYDEVKLSHPEHHQHFWEDPSLFALAGAESFHDLQARAIEAVEEIIRENEGRTVLVVSHGAFIKALLSHYEGRHLSQFWHPPKMTNCCHSIMERGPDGTSVICQYAGLTDW
ncbi:histidine phosphatase family protein [Proteobacteria bacterium 005FR1]|nr:histidine phosphatase family protein [Proteobacteria bacterium 005FR1]